MKIRDVLSGKGDYVETIRPSVTVGEAVRLLARLRIGALVVLEADDRLAGLIDEREILDALAARGTDVLQMTVTHAMKRRPARCEADQDVVRVMALMTRERVRHVLVMDGERLVGIVSIGDLVKHRIQEAELEVRVLRDYARTRGLSTKPASPR